MNPILQTHTVQQSCQYMMFSAKHMVSDDFIKCFNITALNLINLCLKTHIFISVPHMMQQEDLVIRSTCTFVSSYGMLSLT